MKKAALFLLNGFEETEALVTADLLRRAGIDLVTVSLQKDLFATGKQRIVVQADLLFSQIGNTSFDMLILPGGTTDYLNHAPLLDMLRTQNRQGKALAAICAAPAVLGKIGLLKGKRAVCFPGMESWLEGAVLGDRIVETDANITTSKGPATAMHFALRLIEILEDKAAAQNIAKAFLLPLLGGDGF
jgi:4-methyl-5(b-hydroxyethyl)-thiazole monophosphate biosynthesis